MTHNLRGIAIAVMTEAKQGHRYQWNSIEVMAMESGPFPVVHRISHGNVWQLSYLGRVNADSLKPLPMRYFGEPNVESN